MFVLWWVVLCSSKYFVFCFVLFLPVFLLIVHFWSSDINDKLSTIVPPRNPFCRASSASVSRKEHATSNYIGFTSFPVFFFLLKQEIKSRWTRFHLDRIVPLKGPSSGVTKRQNYSSKDQCSVGLRAGLWTFFPLVTCATVKHSSLTSFSHAALPGFDLFDFYMS